MALFQTNILKLTETANQTQSPKLQEKLNGHLQETTLRQGGRGVCPVPAGWMKTVAQVLLATELRCRCRLAPCPSLPPVPPNLPNCPQRSRNGWRTRFSASEMRAAGQRSGPLSPRDCRD